MRNYDRDDIYKGEEKTVFSEEIAFALNEQLTKTHIYQLSSFEQFRLADVVECIGTVEKHRRSLDANGCRFLVFFRQHHVRNRRQPVAELSPISWREIVWAYHSESQDILADLVSRHYHGKMLWSQARESGLFMWMGNMASLVCSLNYLTYRFIKFPFSEISLKQLPATSIPKPKRKILLTALFTTSQ